jgi:hypothetical protein
MVKNFGYSNADVLLCRDHCGPGFKSGPEDYYETVETDIEAGFDLIHVDFCHLQADHQEKLEKSKDLIKHIQVRDKDMMFEIGTDENVGTAEVDLARIENDIDFFLSFCNPEFYVVQTGSLVKEINQVGNYDEALVEGIAALLHHKGIRLKEHNADYLFFGDLKQRRNIVDAINIAPMLGVLQTNYVLYRCLIHGFDTTDFLNKSYESGRWKKWLYKNNNENKYLCSLAAGHYVFSSDEYRYLIDRLERVENIKLAIVDEHYKLIDNYMKGLNANIN